MQAFPAQFNIFYSVKLQKICFDSYVTLTFVKLAVFFSHHYVDFMFLYIFFLVIDLEKSILDLFGTYFFYIRWNFYRPFLLNNEHHISWPPPLL